jgi:hypothetical protein
MGSGAVRCLSSTGHAAICRHHTAGQKGGKTRAEEKTSRAGGQDEPEESQHPADAEDPPQSHGLTLSRLSSPAGRNGHNSCDSPVPGGEARGERPQRATAQGQGGGTPGPRPSDNCHDQQPRHHADGIDPHREEMDAVLRSGHAAEERGTQRCLNERKLLGEPLVRRQRFASGSHARCHGPLSGPGAVPSPGPRSCPQAGCVQAGS